MSTYRAEIFVCGGKACHESGSHKVKELLEKELLRQGLNHEIRVVETECNGFCAQGPVLKVEPEGIVYQKLKEEDIPKLVEEHFVKGQPVKKLFLKPAAPPESIPDMEEIPFYSMCTHHFVPFYGHGHIAYIPNERIVGLSKLPRLLDFFARRPQLQERLTEQVASVLEEELKPLGVMVVIEARHLCVEMRGVRKPGSVTVTSAIRGIFMQKAVREEFLDLLRRRG